MPERTLLTGATGYIGGRLLRVLEEGGARRAGVRNIIVSTFTYRSIIDAPASEVFRWHEQPQALATLTPALVRIVQQQGGIRDGGLVTVSIGVGSLRMRWRLRHYGYVAGQRFCDEQEQGPFAEWRHTHLFQPVGSSQTLYEDRIEWAVPGGPVLNRFARITLHPLLRLGFAHRHRVVRTMVGGHRHGRRPTWRKWAAAGAIVASAILYARGATAQTGEAVRTVPSVDLDKYAGDWYEIARYPNRFQRQCVGDVRASYGRRADGQIDVVNRCRTADGQTEAHGVARIVDDHTFAKLKVRFAPAWLSFVPVVWGDYWIIGLAPDYSWAVVGDPDRDYLWILARAPRLDDESLAAARAAARDNGFAIDRLVSTPQAGAPRR